MRSRWAASGIAASIAWLVGCSDRAIHLKLALPRESETYDLSCVRAVDVLALGPGDTMPLDLGARTSTNVACIDLGRTVTTFVELEAALANKIDVPIPAGGLAAIEVRGRAGTCADKPPQYEAIFYGGAVDRGNDDLTIPLARNISCDAGAQFTVKPVNLYTLFSTKTCTDYVDASTRAFSADLRPTLISRQPLAFETGRSTQTMSAATAAISSFDATYQGTCAVIALASGDGSITGQACINAGASTACAGSNLELAVLPTAYAQTSRDASITSYKGWSFLGVWTRTGTPGPLAGATVTVDSGGDAKVVYGELGATAFQPNATATATTASGMVMLYTNDIVSVTVAAPGKTARSRVYVGADPLHPSSAIVVLD